MTRSISGLRFRIISPSAFFLIGLPISIQFCRTGWYMIEHDRFSARLMHHKPFASRDEAIASLAKFLRNAGAA